MNIGLGLGNKIIPFKGREVNVARPVKVYRNLHAKTVEHKYSVSQDGLVVGHTNQLMLQDCRFHVSLTGQAKVRKFKRKIVHAIIIGKVSVENDLEVTADKGPLPCIITYNPYQDAQFVCRNMLYNHPIAVERGELVLLRNEGVTAFNITTK